MAFSKPMKRGHIQNFLGSELNLWMELQICQSENLFRTDLIVFNCTDGKRFGHDFLLDMVPPKFLIFHSRDPTIIGVPFSCDVLDIMLEYIYTDFKIYFPPHYFPDILLAAKFFELKDLHRYLKEEFRAGFEWFCHSDMKLLTYEPADISCLEELLSECRIHSDDKIDLIDRIHPWHSRKLLHERRGIDIIHHILRGNCVKYENNTDPTDPSDGHHPHDCIPEPFDTLPPVTPRITSPAAPPTPPPTPPPTEDDSVISQPTNFVEPELFPLLEIEELQEDLTVSQDPPNTDVTQSEFVNSFSSSESPLNTHILPETASSDGNVPVKESTSLDDNVPENEVLSLANNATQSESTSSDGNVLKSGSPSSDENVPVDEATSLDDNVPENEVLSSANNASESESTFSDGNVLKSGSPSSDESASTLAEQKVAEGFCAPQSEISPSGRNEPASMKQSADSDESTPGNQPTPSSHSSPRSQPTPSSHSSPRSQPTPSSHFSPRSPLTPSSHSSPANQPTPSSHSSPTNQPTPSSHSSPRSQHTPQRQNSNVSRPGSNPDSTLGRNDEVTALVNDALNILGVHPRTSPVQFSLVNVETTTVGPISRVESSGTYYKTQIDINLNASIKMLSSEKPLIYVSSPTVETHHQ